MEKREKIAIVWVGLIGKIAIPCLSVVFVPFTLAPSITTFAPSTVAREPISFTLTVNSLSLYTITGPSVNT